MPKGTYMAAAGATLPVAVVLGAWMRRRNPWPLLAPGQFTLSTLVWTIFGTLGLTLLALSLAEPLTDLFPSSKDELGKLTREIASMPSWKAWLIVCVLAPLAEESLFRGALLRGFRASWGVAAGVAVSSGLFAIFHELAPRMVVTFCMGLWLGGLTLKSGGLALAVLSHALNNATALMLMGTELREVPIYFAIPGALAVALASWRLFGTRKALPDNPR
ncbi:MAG TPA: CPBP family intramembrane glutamic endopeptidase [Planctomycetota bacterium]|nr:CPBP family intramembrane glutamic endopeptidase [Planctomycetota bacterium]